MQTIGERLEEARKRKGISIREAADATKIRGEYLHKFEGNHFEIGLPEVYVRGFLRTYGNFLRLPADKLVTDYQALGVGERDRAKARLPGRELYGRMELSASSAAANEAGARGRPAGEEGSGAAATATAAAAAGGHAPAPTRETSFRQSLEDRGIDPAALLKFGMIAAAVLVLGLAVWMVTSLVLNRKDAATATQPESTPATEADPLAGARDQAITLVATDAVRVKVVQKLDGKELFQGTLARNETLPVTSRGPMYITASAGQNLQVEVGGRRYPLGFTGYDRAEVDLFKNQR